LTVTDPLVGTEPTPLPMLADVAPMLTQLSVLDCPGAMVAGLAVKETIAGGGSGPTVTESGAVRIRAPPDAVTVAA
jgi:hypothetical protein